MNPLDNHSNRLSELELAQQEIARLKVDLMTANQKYQNLFENGGDSIFLIDLETSQIIDLNTHAARRLGYSRDEMLGMSLDDIEVIDDTASVEAISWESTYSGTQVHECYFRHKDGHLLPVEVSSQIVSIKDQLVSQTFVRNISVRKAMEAERLQLIADLDSFAHTVAHDLKTPLSTLYTWSAWLKNTWEELSIEELKDFLDQMTQNSQRAINIVEELLLFASIRKLDTLETAPLDMASIVTEAITRLTQMIDDSHAEIILPEDWHIGIGYAPWILEIWVNYISNAIKYGGTPPRIELGSRVEADYTVRYWIRDNGQGIEANKLPDLFNMFDRLGEMQIQGHGLGLSIVKRITEKLNGQVKVETEVGQGSIFSFTLPAPY